MARKKRCKVFVSYSRHDEGLVKPLAGLLGVATDDSIFLDVASIKPGDRWKNDIDGALRESSVFVVCWCCQAEKSEFIAHEIATALDGKDKRLVPVLFCDTPLPATLADYQWVDLRGQISHACQHSQDIPRPAPIQAMGAPAPQSRSLSKKYWAALGSLAAIILVATLAAGLLMRKSASPPVSQESPETAAAPPSNLTDDTARNSGDGGAAAASVFVVNREFHLNDGNGHECVVTEGDVFAGRHSTRRYWIIHSRDRGSLQGRPVGMWKGTAFVCQGRRRAGDAKSNAPDA